MHHGPTSNAFNFSDMKLRVNKVIENGYDGFGSASINENREGIGVPGADITMGAALEGGFLVDLAHAAKLSYCLLEG